jgi:probable rRNA maturation factor
MPDPDHPAIVLRSKLAPSERRDLRAFARRLYLEVTQGRSFTCLLTSDADLRAWNREFLGKDYPTDVLSFPSDSPGGDIGEIAISVDRAAEQARRHGHTLHEEIRVLMLHGVLHLCGMDHERDQGQMRRAETKWRRALGLPGGLIERTRQANGARRAASAAKPRAGGVSARRSR